MENSSELVCGFTGQFYVSFGDSFEQTYVKYRIVVDVILSGIFCVFGLIGNIMSFVVLGFISGQSTPVLLRALALADILYLIACLFFQVFKPIHYYIPAVTAALPKFAYIEMVVWPFATMAQTASVWLIVLVSGDRYLGISRPLHAKSVATRARALIAIFCVGLFAIFFNLPTAFDLTVKPITDPCTNETRFEAAASDLSKSPTYQLVYKVIFCFIFRTAIPLVSVIGFNVQILRAIRRSRHQSCVESSRDKSLTSLNKVVACVVCIFVVCELPDFTYRLLRVVMFYSRTHQLDWTKVRYFAHFTNFMLTVNSSINFIAYYVMGMKFRQILGETCTCQRQHQLGVPLASRQTSLSTTKTTSLVVRMQSQIGHNNCTS